MGFSQIPDSLFFRGKLFSLVKLSHHPKYRTRLNRTEPPYRDNNGTGFLGRALDEMSMSWMMDLLIRVRSLPTLRVELRWKAPSALKMPGLPQHGVAPSL
jgi:hypothetical protein